MQIELPSGTVQLPRSPIDVPANSDFIWPLNLDLGAGNLLYSTAQALYRLDSKQESTYFFFAIPGLRPEFAFDAASVASVRATSGSVHRADGCILVDDPEPGRETVLEVLGKNGRKSRILLLTQNEAEQLWQISLQGQEIVMLSPADVFAGEDGVHLRSLDPSHLKAAIFTPSGRSTAAGTLWQERTWKAEERKIDFEWNPTRNAEARPAIRMVTHVHGRDVPMPTAPQDADFAGAAAWTLKIPVQSMTGLSDIFLRVHYTGDVARLSLDGRLLDDDFYNGRAWEIGLKRFLPEAFGKKLQISILPLSRNLPIYLDARAWKAIDDDGQSAHVSGVDLLPEYEVVYTRSEP